MNTQVIVDRNATLSRDTPTEKSRIRHRVTPCLPQSVTCQDTNIDTNNDYFSNIILTPRPGLPARVQSDETIESNYSKASRLPSPDFTSRPARITDIFNIDNLQRKFSFVRSLKDSDKQELQSYNSPSHQGRESPRQYYNTPKFLSSQTHDRKSLGSRTSSSTSTIDSGKTYLLSGITTSTRFTHRWPKPASLKRLNSGTSVIDLNSKERTKHGDFNVGLGFEYFGSWTVYKWVLFLSIATVLTNSLVTLSYTINTWYQTWDHAVVMLVADGDILVLATLYASLLLLTALVGLLGVLLNSRPLLAIYNLLLWPAITSLLSVGYIAYKRSSFALERKLNHAWSQWYTDAGRAIIQHSLRCCGFTDSLHEAVYDTGIFGGCYARTSLPGCKGPLLRFERENLSSIWKTVFTEVPLHIASIIIALLCSNHVTKTFGTGLTPKAYRLKVSDVHADARQLLENAAKEREGSMCLPGAVACSTSRSVWREDRMY